MAYKPILAPEEFHAWLRARADKRGVSMAVIMREMAAQDTDEAPAAVVPTNAKPQPAQVPA